MPGPRECNFPLQPSRTLPFTGFGIHSLCSKGTLEENGKTHPIIFFKKGRNYQKKTADLKIQLSSHLLERQTGGRWSFSCDSKTRRPRAGCLRAFWGPTYVLSPCPPFLKKMG